ncbi:MAG: glycosyl transferase family 39 [uncultured bacterium]|nr:MAG: glycosyl transferase family 39 [uncultured bacterium]KKU14947.1 MAG: hypothetical protein UX21_C0008G0002 [Microgenomates group bacterium GW2011_GWC2_45_8]KKU26233.1 MAG: hypothetical protein UX37_C0004G0028 [Microgenomates group bacterium GW2011_GWA2_46_16]
MSKLIIILAVFSLVGFLRFYQLGNIPQGLTQDEAYYLYDGYSILKTGKDILGNKLPLMFRSTGEYKLNLTYLIAGSIPLVGLNTTAARFPSSITGFLTLIVLGVIVSEITGNRWLGLFSSIILGFSPWHFGISRLFYESNVGAFFLLFTTLMATRILHLPKKPAFSSWVFLGLFSALSAYFYGPFRYLSIGLVILTILLTWCSTHRLTRSHFAVLLTYILFMLPIGSQAFSRQGLMRLFQTTKLQTTDYVLKINEIRSNCFLTMNKNPLATKLCYVLWNRPTLFITRSALVGIRLLSPEYLFFESVDTYIVPRENGAYLSLLLPFYLLGIFYFMQWVLVKDRVSIFLLSSLAGSSLIASLGGDISYHRNTYGLLLIAIIITMGIKVTLDWLKKHLPSKFWLGIIVFLGTSLLLIQNIKYLTYYFTNHVISQPLLFKYDAPLVYDFMSKNRDFVIFDNIFFAPVYAGIYWHLDPADFQLNAKWAYPDQWGFTNADRWGKLSFRGPNIYDLLCQKHHNPTVPINTFFVDDAIGPFSQQASYISRDYTGSLALHAVYDIDELYTEIITSSPGDLCPK